MGVEDHNEERRGSVALQTADNVEQIEAPVTWKAYLMCAFASFGGIFFGYDSGYINGVNGSKYFIHQVEGAGADSLSESHTSLITSILSCGTFFGALIAGDLADRIGRKWTVIIGCFIYAIGVVIQMITGHGDAPVSYTHLSKIRWRDVSLRMLASYLGGSPANYGFSDFYLLKEVFLAYGLPPIDDSDYPTCGVVGLNKGCTGQDIISGMRESYPQTTPNERPAYSNMAFVLLGMALEEYTAKTYAQLLEEIVSCPLDTKNTFPSPGDDEKAVIPPGDRSWGSDYKLNTPAGGLVSSLSDLSKFSHALLSRTLNMTSTEINGWLKPNAFAGNAYTLTGMPWEILRLSNLTPSHPHAVTAYGKSGGAQNYRSQLSFVDDYGLTIIILTAGPMKAAPILTNAMLSTFVAAADEVSREQAKRHEQSYMSDHEDDVPIEAALAQDNDSMILASLRRNDSDILSSLTDIWGLTLGDFLPGVGPKIRVFPSQLRENATLDGELVTKEVWHLWPDLNSGFETDLPGNWIEDMNCIGWSIQDWVHYGGEPLDRVLLYVGEDGDVRGFEVPFLRSGILHPILNDKKT